MPQLQAVGAPLASAPLTPANPAAASRPPPSPAAATAAAQGGVQMKCWDIGGQAQYRSEWGRYTRGCDVIMYVVDAAALGQIALARKELHRLLEDRELASTPLLVLANKIDLEPHISEAELIRELNLDYIVDNPWLVIPISALRTTNIDQVVQWLTKQSSR